MFVSVAEDTGLADDEPVIGLSIFGMTLGQFLFHWALDYASVVQVATLVTTMPIFVVFVVRIVEGTPVTGPKIVSGVGAFLGCLFLLTDWVLHKVEGGASSGFEVFADDEAR